MADDDLGRMVVLPLTPYYSRRSDGAYFQAVQDALPGFGRSIDVAYVDRWNREPMLIDAFAAKAGDGPEASRGERVPRPRRPPTAHRLPRKLIKDGDPYETVLRETMSLI